ncbi:hypothetical protein DFH28DRAFT_880356 [Melampsora americana]|nr:hypothetical protein DFH28DRAFT_880356 [Melampsora americana]
MGDPYSQPNSSNPYGYSSIPPVPPLPPHLVHLNTSLPRALSSTNLNTSSLTPQALLNRLDQLLQAKSHEIQLAGQLGNSLLEQQAELELRIAELEASGALVVDSSSKSKQSRRDRERTPGPNDINTLSSPSKRDSGTSEVSEDDANELNEDARKKVQELEVEMKRWQEGNAEIWRQARGEISAISRPSTPLSTSPNGAIPVTPLNHQHPDVPTIFSPHHKIPTSNEPPATNQSSLRRARNAQHRANDIEFATEIGQSLLGEVRRLQALLAEKEDELMEAKEEKEGLWERNEGLSDRIRTFEASVGMSLSHFDII